MPSSSRVHLYRNTYPSPSVTAPLRHFWLKCRCFKLPPRPTLERHLGGLACVSRTRPPGVGRGAPPAVRGLPRGQVCLAPCGGTVTSVGYYGELGVLRDHVGSGCLYPFGTGGYSACYQCVGWRRPNVVALGSPGAGCPAVPGDAVGVFPPRCTTPTMVAW